MIHTAFYIFIIYFIILRAYIIGIYDSAGKRATTRHAAIINDRDHIVPDNRENGAYVGHVQQISLFAFYRFHVKRYPRVNSIFRNWSIASSPQIYCNRLNIVASIVYKTPIWPRGFDIKHISINLTRLFDDVIAIFIISTGSFNLRHANLIILCRLHLIFSCAFAIINAYQSNTAYIF